MSDTEARSTTISPAYVDMQRMLHENADYGDASLQFARMVARVIREAGARSLTDYGAGKCNLRKGLADEGITDIDYRPYDPAFPEYGEPRPADVVCCIDVLEHVELEYVDAVIAELASLTQKIAFLTVASGPSSKLLPDGRNAHLIQQPPKWWLPKFEARFRVVHGQPAPSGFCLLAVPLH